MDEEGEDAKAKKSPPVMLDTTPAENPLFHDLYPARKGDSFEFTYWQLMWGHGKTLPRTNLCENNVINVLETAPLVQALIGALDSAGCPVTIDRHISCEICKPGRDVAVNFGGYDEAANQVFVCANNCTHEGYLHGQLVRGLIQMFDACTAKVDFRNADHLACMEVRKANLGSCNWLDYQNRLGSSVAVREKQSQCVKLAAVESLVKAKFVDEKVAAEAVDRVFNKCYKDLEPVGRRGRSFKDFIRTKDERYLLGYN